MKKARLLRPSCEEKQPPKTPVRGPKIRPPKASVTALFPLEKMLAPELGAMPEAPPRPTRPFLERSIQGNAPRALSSAVELAAHNRLVAGSIPAGPNDCSPIRNSLRVGFLFVCAQRTPFKKKRFR